MKFKTFILCVFILLLTVVMGASDGLRFFDKTNDSSKVTEHEETEIHNGNSFTVQFQGAVTNTNEQTVIGFTTPNTTRWFHLVAIGESTGVASFLIAEVTSIDPNEGTDAVVYNRNRNSSTTSLILSLTETTGVGAVGKVTTMNETQAASANITTTTTIYHEDIGSAGSPITSSGGGTRGLSEFVLKQNTEYAIILNAEDASDQVHNIILDFYEHTDAISP